jgi:hypothetical protein
MFIGRIAPVSTWLEPALMLKLSSSKPSGYLHFLDIGYSILPTDDAIRLQPLNREV